MNRQYIKRQFVMCLVPGMKEGLVTDDHLRETKTTEEPAILSGKSLLLSRQLVQARELGPCEDTGDRSAPENEEGSEAVGEEWPSQRNGIRISRGNVIVAQAVLRHIVTARIWEKRRVEWTRNKRLHTEKDEWGDHIDTKCNLVTVAGLPVSPPHSHGSTWPRWAKESR
ncbi:hypothetical protein BGW80DRAFT_1445481 [Lactifluus volemus]|nr:hypothetical protein BGW80DRAFT_1445481 [Lactifluus volemus]